ncbi:MAG: hypothetical protein WCK67_00600 [bacterium]
MTHDEKLNKYYAYAAKKLLKEKKLDLFKWVTSMNKKPEQDFLF